MTWKAKITVRKPEHFRVHDLDTQTAMNWINIHMLESSQLWLGFKISQALHRKGSTCIFYWVCGFI